MGWVGGLMQKYYNHNIIMCDGFKKATPVGFEPTLLTELT